MVKAYVLIKAASGKEEDVIKALNQMSVTDEAHGVFGGYDIVAEIRGRDMETLIEIVTGKIRKIDGIIDTETLLIVDFDLDISSSSLAS